MQIHRGWPSGLTEVESPAGKKESTASFWQVNFFGPWTWLAPLLSPYPNFFTASGGRGRVGGISDVVFHTRVNLFLHLLGRHGFFAVAGATNLINDLTYPPPEGRIL